MKTYRNNRQKKILWDIVAIALMGVWAYFINRQRPLFKLTAWVELWTAGNKIWLIEPISLVILLLTGIICYYFIIKIADNRVLAFLGSIAIITTRFSYYNLGQLSGLMGSISMILVIIMCILLYDFMHSGKGGYYYLAVLVYVISSLIRERYIVLLLMLFYALVTTKDKHIPRYLVAVVSFFAILGSRLYLIETLLPVETEGIKVAENFTISGYLEAVVMELKYLVGINAGPKSLCGIEWEMMSDIAQKLVISGIVLMGVILLTFLIRLFKNIDSKKTAGIAIRDVVFFLGFIIGCVLVSSVAINIEMRWISTSFVMLVFAIMYMYGYARKSDKKSPVVLAIIVCLLCIIFITEDMYYRQYLSSTNSFQNQQQNNIISEL